MQADERRGGGPGLGRRWPVLAVLMVLAAGCGLLGGADDRNEPEDGGPDSPVVDGDGDVDGDTDTDADGDIDGDVDGDADEGGLFPVYAGVCFDGEAQDDADLSDCEEPGCMTERRCCRDSDRSWVEGDFDLCADLAACGWSTFEGRGDGGAVTHEEGSPWLLLGGDGVGEAGAFTEPVIEASSQPTVSFVAALSAASCTAEGCRQALGVALTAQGELSAGTGVVPSLGMVLDGDLGAVHLVVAGRAEASVPVGLDELVHPRGYGFALRPDGSADFWVAVPVGDVARAADVDLGRPVASSTTRLSTEGPPLRVALFGRLAGGGAAEVSALAVRRRVCDDPSGFQRARRAIAFAPAAAADRAGRPAVLYRPDVGDYLMLYETADGRLGRALSEDGLDFRPQGEPGLYDGLPPTGYGLVARRAPTLLLWAPDQGEPVYHLWFEAQSEDVDHPVAIVHATSEDGLAWVEPMEGSVALEGSETLPWRRHVSQPSVSALPSGELVMVFVGRDPATGETALGLARSTDGESWSAEDEPLVVAGLEVSGLAPDAVAQPCVVARGAMIHLWLTGLEGARSSIGYAVGDGAPGSAFTFVGVALAGAEEWEARRVAAPAVITGPAEDAGLVELRLYYQAGAADHEAVGVATREIPGQVL